MSTYSIGVVTNTSALGSAASTIVLNVSNVNTFHVSVIVKIVASVDFENFYTAHLSGFVVLHGAYEVMTYNIAGNVAYEVQVFLSIPTPSGPPPTLVSVYGIDEFGNPVVNQGFTTQDLIRTAEITLD
ncbi:hypothetical protein [Paenibacillus sp. BC26]|uniref:hypothetical protein n=1 Tax=Paenibacillus sp. BC26 TaxID=1881032 RepID=UPI0008F221A2|nr:hypothetical protein [Paenibacillus sp. BC26]SFT08949.1 hypothetical protein SAMN05428962_4300 [Paenibacillus sp. BC26]